MICLVRTKTKETQFLFFFSPPKKNKMADDPSRVPLVGTVSPCQRFQTDGIREVMVGPFNQQYQSIAATTASMPGNVIFDVQPNDVSQIFDRLMFLQVQVSVVYTIVPRVAAFTAGGGQYLWNGMNGGDALRMFPLNQMMTECSITLNNNKISFNPQDIIDIAPFIGSDFEKLMSGVYDGTATAPDTIQKFDDYQSVAASAQNASGAKDFIYTVSQYNRDPFMPVGGYVGRGNVRGGVKVVSVVNNQTALGLDAPNLVTVTYEIIEPILAPPFNVGPNEPGLTGLNKFQLAISFTNAVRMVTRKPLYPTGQAWNNGSSVCLEAVNATLVNGKCNLLYCSYTPSQALTIPKRTTYNAPYIQRFESSLGQVAPNLHNQTGISNNIVLPTIPSMIYVFVGRSTSFWAGATEYPWYHPQSFGIIKKCVVQYGTEQYLATLDTASFYQLAIKYGLNMTWEEYSKNIGSIVCLRMGDCIPLRQVTEAPGVQQNNNFSVNITYDTPDYFKGAVYGNNNHPWSIYTVVVYPGTMVIENGRTNLMSAVVDPTDVGTAMRGAASRINQAGIVPQMIESTIFGNGIDFEGGFNLGRQLQKAGKFASKIGANVVKDLGHEGQKWWNKKGKDALYKGTHGLIRAVPGVGKTVSAGLKLAGLGLRGGSFMGGAIASRDSLKRTANEMDEEMDYDEEY
jgi:hypothetical protein